MDPRPDPADGTGLAGRWPLAEQPALRDRLLAAWGDPARGYHDRRHLGEVLDRLDELAAAGEEYDDLSVRLAAWFHDAVHEGREDDEERSADLAREELDRAGVPDAVVAEVVRLVLMTREHRPDDDDPSGCALSDADLAILAAPADRYAEYAATVRGEYAHVPDDLFRRGRAAVLADLAAKPALFQTATARARWETAARENLVRELATLHP